MNKQFIIDRLDTQNYSVEKLKKWIDALPGKKGGALRPNTDKIGDVYLHPVFLHPYVLLEKKEDGWLCGLLTSSENCKEILCEARSRFFSDSYFTETLFMVRENTGPFYGVYDNTRHLKTVLLRLKKLICEDYG